MDKEDLDTLKINCKGKRTVGKVNRNKCKKIIGSQKLKIKFKKEREKKKKGRRKKKK